MKCHILPPKRVKRLRYPDGSLAFKARDRYAWLGELIFWVVVLTWISIVFALYSIYFR